MSEPDEIEKVRERIILTLSDRFDPECSTGREFADAADAVIADLGLEVAGWREVRHAPGFDDDGISFPIKTSEVYEGRRYLRPDHAAWTTCEPVYRISGVNSQGQETHDENL